MATISKSLPLLCNRSLTLQSCKQIKCITFAHNFGSDAKDNYSQVISIIQFCKKYTNPLIQSRLIFQCFTSNLLFFQNNNVAPQIRNRNPMNLEKMTIGYKPNGFPMERRNRNYWNALDLSITVRSYAFISRNVILQISLTPRCSMIHSIVLLYFRANMLLQQ